MQLSNLKTALLTVTQKVFHYGAPPQTGSYIVWSEDGQSGSVHADGKMKEQTIQGTVDYFTKTEYDAAVGQIQTALNNAGIGFRLDSVQFEDDTKYIHYQWIFDLPTVVV